MTKADTARLLAVIVMAYPNYDKFKDEKHIKEMTNAWADLFTDDDPTVVALAIKRHIATSKWPPSIAEIREIMADITNPDIIAPEEAWAAVQKLMYTHPEHLYQSAETYLPKPIAAAVDAVGYGTLWALHCAAARGYSNKAGLDRVAFLQAYDGQYNKAWQRARLPGTLLKQIDQVSAAHATGERAMLEAVNKQYTEHRDAHERNYSSFALEEPDEMTSLAERHTKMLEAGYEAAGQEEDE